MAKFINIDDDTVINIEEIEGIQRELFDLGERDFIGKEIGTGREVEFDYLTSVLAKIYFKNGRILDVKTIIYSDDDYVQAIDKHWKELVRHLDCKLITL